MVEPDVITFPSDSKPRRRDIIAAQKIIADISSGVYRSPAAAMKELVANSYDADATRVTISTDPPHLRTFSITDDGTGMTVDDFLDVMAHIGGSRKRKDGDESPVFKRKLIGRIGIGLLSVAQLGTRFYLSSKKKGQKTRFLAEVNLEPFHKDETALLSMATKQDANDDSVVIGAIQYVDNIPDEVDSQFTVIIVPDAKKGLSSEINGLARSAVGATALLSVKDAGVVPFYELIKLTSGQKRADLVVDNYYYMLWELGLLCPVDYLGMTPFHSADRNIVDLDALRLPGTTGFNVIVDGVQVRRPQWFPSVRSMDYFSPDPKVYPLNYQTKVAERILRLYGYVYCQQPSITPEEVKGVHIRIRNVGIGMYDRTWLGYPFDEGLKFGQISGEIFIEEGLESALNIDRDSFRETDVHFQALKAYLWSILRGTVFPDFKARQREFRKERESKVERDADWDFEKALLRLPSPTRAVEQDVSGDALLNRMRVDENSPNGPAGSEISSQNWSSMVSAHNLTDEAKSRLLKVLRVLVSSELFQGMVRDDLELILAALAAAVR